MFYKTIIVEDEELSRLGKKKLEQFDEIDIIDTG
jgi:hypothetical protein